MELPVVSKPPAVKLSVFLFFFSALGCLGEAFFARVSVGSSFVGGTRTPICFFWGEAPFFFGGGPTVRGSPTSSHNQVSPEDERLGGAAQPIRIRRGSTSGRTSWCSNSPTPGARGLGFTSTGKAWAPHICSEPCLWECSSHLNGDVVCHWVRRGTKQVRINQPLNRP